MRLRPRAASRSSRASTVSAEALATPAPPRLADAMARTQSNRLSLSLSLSLSARRTNASARTHTRANERKEKKAWEKKGHLLALAMAAAGHGDWQGGGGRRRSRRSRCRRCCCSFPSKEKEGGRGRGGGQGAHCRSEYRELTQTAGQPRPIYTGAGRGGKKRRLADHPRMPAFGAGRLEAPPLGRASWRLSGDPHRSSTEQPAVSTARSLVFSRSTHPPIEAVQLFASVLFLFFHLPASRREPSPSPGFFVLRALARESSLQTGVSNLDQSSL